MSPNVYLVIESPLAGGNYDAVDLLLSVIYDESRKFAAKYLGRQHPGTPYSGALRRMRLDVPWVNESTVNKKNLEHLWVIRQDLSLPTKN